MKFFSKSVGDRYAALLLDDDNEELFHLSVPCNDVSAWLAGFLLMSEDAAGRNQCRKLINQIGGLSGCQREEQSPCSHIFLSVMCALLRFLQRPESAVLEGRSAAQSALCGLLQANAELNFKALVCSGGVGGEEYRYGVMVDRRTCFDSRVDEPGLRHIPANWWTCLLHGEWVAAAGTVATGDADGAVREECLASLLTYIDVLCDIVVVPASQDPPGENRTFILESFADLCIALVEFLAADTSARFVTFRRRKIFDLCALVVAQISDDPEEYKPYLDRMLRGSETPEIKARRLFRLVQVMKRDRVEGEGAVHEWRLAAVIDAIAAHFLSQYDLERAAEFWRLLDRRDWLLRLTLSMYDAPVRYALGTLVLFLLLTGLTAAINLLPPGGEAARLLGYIARSMLALIVLAGILALGFIAWRFITLRGLDYMELFLPRLLGAIAVGLSVLLLQDTAWRLGLQLQPLNLVLLCGAAYLLSFVYIFTDVHKTLRLQPLGRSRASAPIHQSIAASLKVFCIGLSEAFSAVLFSSIILSEVMPAEVLRSGNWLTKGFTWHIDGILSLAFMPVLVLVWTGLSLFIGAFVQLIWQDRRITSPL